MEIYVITKEGNYTAGVLAVREDKLAAITAAMDFASIDKDAYHSYSVELFDTEDVPRVIIKDFYMGQNAGKMIGCAKKNTVLKNKAIWTPAK